MQSAPCPPPDTPRLQSTARRMGSRRATCYPRLEPAAWNQQRMRMPALTAPIGGQGRCEKISSMKGAILLCAATQAQTDAMKLDERRQCPRLSTRESWPAPSWCLPWPFPPAANPVTKQEGQRMQIRLPAVPLPPPADDFSMPTARASGHDDLARFRGVSGGVMHAMLSARLDSHQDCGTSTRPFRALTRSWQGTFA
jgi:hypothetical protein